MLVELNNKNFDKETKDGLKLIEFYAPWCGYCVKQEEELLKLDKIWIGQVNTDVEKVLLIKNQIRSFPTFLIYNNGKEVERLLGFRTKDELLAYILKHLKN